MAGAFRQRLTAFDDLTRADHWCLRPPDVCHFIGEYTAREGYAYSATNSLILDFKMPVLNAGLPAWRNKEAAIVAAAAALRQAMHPNVLDQLVFVPVPPSQAKGDAGYDDRLVRMLRVVRPGRPLDVRELLVQTRTMEPSHRRTAWPQAAEIAMRYRIDETVAAPEPGVVAVVDDLLTSGAHSRAAKRVLTRRFPGVEVMGVFLARRARRTTGPEAG